LRAAQWSSRAQTSVGAAGSSVGMPVRPARVRLPRPALRTVREHERRHGRYLAATRGEGPRGARVENTALAWRAAMDPWTPGSHWAVAATTAKWKLLPPCRRDWYSAKHGRTERAAPGCTRPKTRGHAAG